MPGTRDKPIPVNHVYEQGCGPKNIPTPTDGRDASTKEYVDEAKTAAQDYADSAVGAHEATEPHLSSNEIVALITGQVGVLFHEFAYGGSWAEVTSGTWKYAIDLSGTDWSIVPGTVSIVRVTGTAPNQIAQEIECNIEYKTLSSTQWKKCDIYVGATTNPNYEVRFLKRKDA